MPSRLRARQYIHKRLTKEKTIFVTIALVCTYLVGIYLIQNWPRPTGRAKDILIDTDSGDVFKKDSTLLHLRHLLSYDNVTQSGNNSAQNETTSTTSAKGIYPPDSFTLEQMQHGAVILYFLGMIYMFVALAIVCDEFFVPSLDVITENLNISRDVAGATFMAAGGSMPEFFTSLIGVFFADSNVGIGTIVGSAVFNILFVIGTCAVFSKGVLQLTWWPLFRDVFFYSISLGLLIYVFYDAYIQWWESVLLLSCYALYVIFMKFNIQVENFVKMTVLPALTCNKNRISSANSGQQLVHNRSGRTSSLPILRGGSAKFRHGVLQLMIHTIDPLGDNKNINEKAVELHAVASVKVMINQDEKHDQNQNSDINGGAQAVTNGRIMINGTFTATSGPTYSSTGSKSAGHRINSSISSTKTATTTADSLTDIEQVDKNILPIAYTFNERATASDDSSDNKSPQSDDMEEEEEPLDISWPKTTRKQITYVIVAPIVFALWIMLPDVRHEHKRKWFPITFIGSILWIGIFSYFMVWWADRAGYALDIPVEVMGLTFLAAGTSVPDLITSVIVARKGLGDMAVSSSIGSNIFDVTVGLPFPWLLWSLINRGAVDVNSKGLFCSIILLFGMLLLVITSIGVFRWKMSRGLGLSMFMLYAVFLTIALLLEFNIFSCVVGSVKT